MSLHSANAKVRANAMEAVETGIGHALFRHVDAVLRPPEPNAAAPPSGDEIIALAEAALDSGAPVEVAVALALLHQRLSQGEFARRTAPLIRAGMPTPLRRQLLALLDLRRATGPGRVAMIDTLRRTPNFPAATLESLASLAEAARTEPLASAWSGVARTCSIAASR